MILAQLILQWTKPTHKCIRIQPQEGQSQPPRRGNKSRQEVDVLGIVSKSFDTSYRTCFALHLLASPVFCLHDIFIIPNESLDLSRTHRNRVHSFLFFLSVIAPSTIPISIIQHYRRRLSSVLRVTHQTNLVFKQQKCEKTKAIKTKQNATKLATHKEQNENSRHVCTYRLSSRKKWKKITKRNETKPNWLHTPK